MAKRRYEFDEAKLDRFLKEGRGQGTLATYRPWLTIYDVPSSGRVARIPGITCGRLHHSLSDIESGLIRLLDWSDNVTDIREQFPLDRDVTREIAKAMGVEHPRDTDTGVDIVMTTDVLADVKGAQGVGLFARAVKRSADLDDLRTIEKLEIERRYWEANGVDWGIVTERQLPKQRIANIAWASEMYSLEGLAVSYEGYWQDRCNWLLGLLGSLPPSTPIKHVFHALESSHGFLPGEGLTAIRHLVATRVITIDMDKPFSVSGDVGQMQLQDIRQEGQQWKAA